jgi:hypothetical protein
MSDEPKKDLKQFRADNDKRAAAEPAMIKADIRKRLSRILQRMKDAGEVAQHVTLDDLLRDRMP